MGGKVESPFTVEIWDGERLSETIAVAQNVIVAGAAYEAAIGQRPGRTVMLRHGTRVIRTSPRQTAEPPPTVGRLKAQGVQGVRLWCIACGRYAVMSWTRLNASDEQPFPDVGHRLRCSACGGREVQRMPDWPANDAPTATTPF